MNALMLAASEGPNNPILPVTNEIIWGSIAFFALVVLLSKVGYPAVRKAMDDRAAGIQADLDAAETARTEAEATKAQYDQALAEARAEANQIIEQARQEAETVRQERIAAIDGEIAERRAQADADIEAAKERAQAEVQAQVTELAIGAAGAVVEANLDNEANARLVESFIQRVGS